MKFEQNPNFELRIELVELGPLGTQWGRKTP